MCCLCQVKCANVNVFYTPSKTSHFHQLNHYQSETASVFSVWIASMPYRISFWSIKKKKVLLSIDLATSPYIKVTVGDIKKKRSPVPICTACLKEFDLDDCAKYPLLKFWPQKTTSWRGQNDWLYRSTCYFFIDITHMDQTEANKNNKQEATSPQHTSWVDQTEVNKNRTQEKPPHLNTLLGWIRQKQTKTEHRRSHHTSTNYLGGSDRSKQKQNTGEATSPQQTTWVDQTEANKNSLLVA